MPALILRCCICGKSRKVGPAAFGTPKGVDVLIQSSRFPSVIYHTLCGYEIRKKMRDEVGDILDSAPAFAELIPPVAEVVRKG